MEEPEMRLSMRRTEGDIACTKASGVVGVGDRLERNAPESSRFQRNAHFLRVLKAAHGYNFSVVIFSCAKIQKLSFLIRGV